MSIVRVIHKLPVQLLHSKRMGLLGVSCMDTEREQVIELIRSLPENSTIDDIMEELFFRMQVNRGVSELDGSEGIPHEAVKNRLSKWLRK